MTAIALPDPPTRVIEEPPYGMFPMGGAISNLVISVASAADTITPWGVSPRARDLQLRQFWPTEDLFSSALFTTIARYVGFGWSLNGPPRTVAVAQDMLNAVQFGRGPEALFTPFLVDLFCLAGQTRITLGGARRGKKIALRELVETKDVGPVLSYEDGQLVEREVTEWHCTPLGPREWVWLSAKHASGHSGDKKGGVWATNDHPFLTPHGWVQAGDLKAGDKIVSTLPSPSLEQEPLIVGTLLGDSCILRTEGNSAVFRISHNEVQHDWLRLKRDALKGFSWTPERETFGAASTQSTPAMLDWHAHWYVWRDGKWFKRIDREAVKRNFSPMLLAAWYGDDGTKYGGSVASLATDGFDYDDVEWLVELLEEHGYDCTIQEAEGCYARIRFRVAGARKLWDTIAPYLPECLRYKVPDGVLAYNAELWSIKPATGYVDELVAVEHKPLRNPRSGGGGLVVQRTYSIGVAGPRCFAAGNLVSHNTQDNGAFMEIVRTEDDPRAPVISLNHLDAGRCIRTGRIEKPIIYVDLYGKYHEMKWYQVIMVTDMPSPIEEARGLQYCALTRVLRAAQILRDISIVRHEKAAGRFTRQLHLVSGVQTKLIENAMLQKQTANDQMGLVRYAQPVILGSLDPTAKVSKETIDLASIPEEYNEKDMQEAYLVLIAMALGADYQDFAPLQGNGLGGGGNAKILNMKSRGKGAALFMKTIERAFNFHGVLPRSISFKFGDQDIAEQMEKVELRKAQAIELQTYIQSGLVTTEVGRQMMVDSGAMDERYLIMMRESNATDEITVPSTEPAHIVTEDDVKPGMPGPKEAPGGKPPAAPNNNAERNQAPSQDQKRIPGGSK